LHKNFWTKERYTRRAAGINYFNLRRDGEGRGMMTEEQTFPMNKALHILYPYQFTTGTNKI
jgi:hypothetical protein